MGLSMVLMSGLAVAGHGEKREIKKAILLAAFGSSVPEARKALDSIEDRVKKEFPGTEVRWAYTSSIIRAKLAREGKVFDAPEVALARLMTENYTHVAVLSLHIIPGQEFHSLYKNVRLFGQMDGGFDQILVARPLLSSRDDMVQAAKVLLKQLPADRKPHDAVLVMGHGSEKHPADALYLAMNQVFQEMDPNVFLGSVAGYPALDDLLPKLSERKVKKVYLVPFMVVAGDHALKDMAGGKPDSWKSVLEKNGYACETVLKGTIQYPEMVDIWMAHLKEVCSHFELQ